MFQLVTWMCGGVGPNNGLTNYCGQFPTEWWHENEGELPHLARLAIFLLGTLAQGADCKCLFKDMAAHHTKTRSCMSSKTTLESAAIAHSLCRHYAEDHKSSSTKKDM